MGYKKFDFLAHNYGDHVKSTNFYFMVNIFIITQR